MALRVLVLCALALASSAYARSGRAKNVIAVIYYLGFDVRTYKAISEADVVRGWDYKVTITSCGEKCRRAVHLLKKARSSLGGAYDESLARVVMKSQSLGGAAVDLAGGLKGGGMVDVAEFSAALDALMASRECEVERANEHLPAPEERLRRNANGRNVLRPSQVKATTSQN